jgi:hypothetical protein
MKIPAPLKQKLFDLQAQLLDLIDDAASTERELFDIHGETEQNLGDLDSLTGIREQAEDIYQRFHVRALRVVQADLREATATMSLLIEVCEFGQERMVPLTRSIEEIRNTWELR